MADGLLSGKQQAGLRAEDLGDLTALRAAFAQEAADWQAYLGALDDGQIAGEIEMFDWRGNPHTFVRWRILQHVILHGMQHHAELAALLTAQGRRAIEPQTPRGPAEACIRTCGGGVEKGGGEP
ncbi:MAG: hypothetical protein R6W93_09725 [Candidatus Limnocylindrales bacterium]